MKPAQHPNSLRTQQLLVEAGLSAQVVEFELPTRTSAEAATAVGCSVAEIAKSVVFRAKATSQAVVVVASGENRVCEEKVAKLVGGKLGRANADFVRESTGYAIGGVAPLGMQTRSSCCLMLIYRNLIQFGPPQERRFLFSR